MSCRDDKAAKNAISFVALFPQRLSPSLMTAGDVLSIRQVMLKTCMAELEVVRSAALVTQQDEDDCRAVIGESKKLRRTLMLLHALIDESMADAGTRVQPHGGRWKCRPVTVRIQYSQKALSNPTITLDSNDLLEHLMERIAAEIGKPLKELKMFRKGKEIVLGVFRRTLQQLDISPNEVILVADRPQVAAASAAVVDTAMGSYDCPVETLPSVVLSNTPEYLDLLFALLDICSGSLCDDIWGLILRLPTSPRVLRGWREVSSDHSCACDDDAPRLPICLFGLHTEGKDSAAAGSGGGGDMCDSLGAVSASGAIEHITDSYGKRVRVTKSLSRLLYNMQVVETLLHVSDNSPSGADNAMAEDQYPEDSADEDDNWVVMFIFLGGITAIADAMEFTASQLDKYLSTEREGCCCGVTAKLLLCAMGLVTKMYRALMLRGALSHHPQLAGNIQQMLLTFAGFSVGTDSGVTKTQGNNVNGEAIRAVDLMGGDVGGGGDEEMKSGDAEDKENIMPSTAPPSSNSSQASTPVMEELLMASEWGNKLNKFSSAAADLISSSMDLCKVQYTICHFLSLARSFSVQHIFHMDGTVSEGVVAASSSSVLSRTTVQTAQEDMLEVMRNLFTIWTSVVIMSPSALFGVEHRDAIGPDGMELALESKSIASPDCVVDSTELLQALLMGYELEGVRAASASAMRKTHLAATISLLSVEGLSAIVGIAHKVTDMYGDTGAANNEVLKHIYITFMHSVLALRPAIHPLPATPQSARPLDVVSSGKMHFSAASLFEFASRLISAKVNCRSIAMSLPLADVRRVCGEILSEFTDEITRIVRWQKSVSGKYLLRPQLPNVAGSMQLLANLATGEPDICDFLLERNVVDFIINSCVGIVTPEQVRVVTLCGDRESRSVFLFA